MARDILTVPISTVASEASFSLGGCVIFETRSSLNRETAEALICLKDWSLADNRRQEEKRVIELEAEMKNLSLSRSSWIEDSSPDEE